MACLQPRAVHEASRSALPSLLLACLSLLAFTACTSGAGPTPGPATNAAATSPDNASSGMATDGPSDNPTAQVTETDDGVEPAIPIVALSEGSSYVEQLCATDPFSHLDDPDGLTAYAGDLAAISTSTPAEADELAELVRRVERLAGDEPQPDDAKAVADVLRARCSQ